MAKDSFDEMLKEEERMTEKYLREEYENIQEQSYPDASQNNASHKSSTGGIIIGIAVVIFFIGEIIAMAIFSQTNPILCASCLGLLFLVFGIIGVAQTKINWDSWPIIIFPVIGFLLTALPVIDVIWKKKTGETFFTQDRIVIMTTSVFFIAGLLIIIIPLLKRHFMLKVCTERVMAKCIYLDSHISRGKHSSTRVYAPKWEYYIGGTFYEKQETTYTNVKVPRVGDEREILVNPEHPEQIYRPNASALLVLMLMGITFIAISGLTVYIVFFTRL